MLHSYLYISQIEKIKNAPKSSFAPGIRYTFHTRFTLHQLRFETSAFIERKSHSFLSRRWSPPCRFDMVTSEPEEIVMSPTFFTKSNFQKNREREPVAFWCDFSASPALCRLERGTKYERRRDCSAWDFGLIYPKRSTILKSYTTVTSAR